jgi:hypothetical protein
MPGHSKTRDALAVSRRRALAKNWPAFVLGLALLLTLVGGELWVRSAREHRVIIGTNDEVYYYRRATKDDARALGHALRKIGFLNDRGTSVLLWQGSGRSVVSFVLNDGAWNHPDAVSNFAEIGRRIAPSVGGFPLQVCLVDSARVVRKELTVGRANIGARDLVYYFGSATVSDAKALGQALRTAGYFTDTGVSVMLLKAGGTTVSFVVQEGVWDQPDAVATLERLTRMVAASVGGLPLKLRLLDPNMGIRKELALQ